MQKAEGRTRTRRADAGKHRSPTAARSPRPAQRRAARTERGHGRGRGAAVLGAGPPPAATRPFPGAGSAADTERLAPLPAQMAAVSPRGPAPRRPPLATKAPPRRGGGYRGAPPLIPPRPSAPAARCSPGPGARAAGGIGQQGGGGRGGGGARLALPARCPRAALRRAPPRGGRGERGRGRSRPRLAPPRPARVTTPCRAALRRRPATGR